MPKARISGPYTTIRKPLVQDPRMVGRRERIPNRRSTSVATITGQRASSTLPLADTPRDAGTFPAHGDPADSAQSARSAWRSVAPSIAGTPHVRISRDGGRTYPARHARPLPADPPGQPATVPVYDPGSAPAGCWRSTWTRPAPATRWCTSSDATRPGPRARPAARAPRRPVRRRRGPSRRPPRLRPVRLAAALARAARPLQGDRAAVPRGRPGADGTLGGQISPPGSRAKRGGWRVLSTPVDVALAAVEHPNGPEVWAALLTEFAAELQQVELGHRLSRIGDAARRARRRRRPVGAPPRRPREPRS